MIEEQTEAQPDEPIVGLNLDKNAALEIVGELLKKAEANYLNREDNDHVHRLLVPGILRRTAIEASQIYDSMPDALMGIVDTMEQLARATDKVSKVKAARDRLISLAYEQGAVIAKNEAARKAQILMLVPMRPVDQAVETLAIAKLAYDVARLQLDGLKEGRRVLETQINAYNVAIEYEKALGSF